ncbi:hypothetical protein ACO0SA_004414 [Hanseniaspora valbyensis]
MSTSSLNLSDSTNSIECNSLTPLIFPNDLQLIKNKNSKNYFKNEKNHKDSLLLGLNKTNSNNSNIRTNPYKVFSQMDTSDSLSRRAMSISYINKAAKKHYIKNRNQNINPIENDFNDSVDEDYDLTDSESLKSTTIPGGYFTSNEEQENQQQQDSSSLTSPTIRKLKNPLSPQSSASAINMSFLNSINMPKRASIDLSIPLDPTLAATPEEIKSNSRSNTNGSSILSANEIMDIEKKGENLFNSSIRDSQSITASLSSDIDPSVRFSTADAKRLSIINMNNNNNSNSNNTISNLNFPSGSPSSNIYNNNNIKNHQEQQPAANFKNPFSKQPANDELLKVISEPEPFSIRRKMSLKKKSMSGSQSPDRYLEVPDSLSCPPPPPQYNNMSSLSGKRRRSSLLASGDVLSMKMGVLKRTSSSRNDDKSSQEYSSDYSDNLEEDAIELTPASLHDETFTNNNNIINNNNNNNYPENAGFGSTSMREALESPSNLEVDPLDTQPKTKPQSSNRLNKPIINFLSENNKKELQAFTNPAKLTHKEYMPIKQRVQSIAENTRDQLRRSTIISLNSSSSNNSASDSSHSNIEPFTHYQTSSNIGFSYVKTPDSPNSSIDLNKAKSDSEQNLNKDTENKQFNWMEMI